MNSSHIPQKSSRCRLFGVLRPSSAWILIGAFSVGAYSPDSPETAAALELLRSRVASGLAGQESYDAFLDFLAESGAGAAADGASGCQAWADAAASEGPDIRWREIRETLARVCPDTFGNAPVTQDSAAEGRAPGRLKRLKRSHGRLALSQSVRPRQDPAAAGALPPPLAQAEGSLPGASARISFQGDRLQSRFLRAGPSRLSFLAGHLHSALEETRLGFVAGGRFYAGWSGSSGIEGPFASPQSALDGLGLRARAGGWTLEAAGAWNRLRHGSHPDRNDAALYMMGLARHFGGEGSGMAVRSQAARQRFEPASGLPTEITVIGAALANQGHRNGQNGRYPRWSLGVAGSLADLPPATAATARDGGGWRAWGGYVEASLASSAAEATAAEAAGAETAGGECGSGSWKLQWRQADAEWANPLQSPRGYLRDTLEGGWILPGRGEGGLSARMRFPLAAGVPAATGTGYRADLRAGGSGDWGPEGMLSGEGNLAVTQAWGEWIHETGATLAFLRPGPDGSAPVSDVDGHAGRGGWGQSLAWERRPWAVTAAFCWKGGGYSGSTPAPLGLTCAYAGSLAWSAGITAGDVRNPGSYLSAEMHQGWKAGNKIQVDQTLRMPWTREGMASDLGYQLRLAATL